MRVPGFLVRRFYVAGSLRNTADGFQFQAHNDMGQGMLVGVHRVRIDGADVDLAAITATRDGVPGSIRASDISRGAPVPIDRGARVTLHIAGARLAAGKHELDVEIVERDLGSLQLTIDESIAAEPAPA